MKRLVLTAAVAASASLISVPPAYADAYCMTNVGFPVDTSAYQTCTFMADAGPHVFVSNTVNPFRIFVDNNSDGVQDAKDKVLVSSSQNEVAGEFEVYGEIPNVPTGKPITVKISGEPDVLGTVFAK